MSSSEIFDFYDAEFANEISEIQTRIYNHESHLGLMPTISGYGVQHSKNFKCLTYRIEPKLNVYDHNSVRIERESPGLYNVCVIQEDEDGKGWCSASVDGVCVEEVADVLAGLLRLKNEPRRRTI